MEDITVSPWWSCKTVFIYSAYPLLWEAEFDLYNILSTRRAQQMYDLYFCIGVVSSHFSR